MNQAQKGWREKKEKKKKKKKKKESNQSMNGGRSLRECCNCLVSFPSFKQDPIIEIKPVDKHRTAQILQIKLCTKHISRLMGQIVLVCKSPLTLVSFSTGH